MFLKPHFKAGPTGRSGEAFGVYRLPFSTLVVSAPSVVSHPPADPRRMNFGGWTFGAFGLNWWIAFPRWRRGAGG